MRKLIFAIVAFVVVNLILSFIGMGGVSTVGALIAAVITLLVIKSDAGGTGGTSDGFQSDFKHDNIAINSQTGMLWVRDISGKTATLDKDDVLRWTLACTEIGDLSVKNRIELHVQDLKMPMWTVRFNRHGDTWKWNARRNHAEALEWQSRLTTWLKS